MLAVSNTIPTTPLQIQLDFLPLPQILKSTCIGGYFSTLFFSCAPRASHNCILEIWFSKQYPQKLVACTSCVLCLAVSASGTLHFQDHFRIYKPTAQKQLQRLRCNLEPAHPSLAAANRAPKATSLANAPVQGHSGNYNNLGFSLQRELLTYSGPSHLTRMTFLTFLYNQILLLTTLT